MSTSELTPGNYQPIERTWWWVSIFFISGIVAADKFRLPFFILYLLCFAGFMGCFVGLRNKKVFFLSLLFLLTTFGFLRFEIAEIKPSNHIGRYATDEKEKVLLVGTIKDDPKEVEDHYGNKRVNFLFQPSYLIKDNEKIKTSGLVKASIYGRNFADFEYGQSYALEGLLYKPTESLFKDQFNYRKYLEKKGIYALFCSKKYDGYVNLSLDRSNPFLKAVYRLKNDLKQRYRLLLPQPYCSLLSAFILGDREDIPESLYDSFIHIGTVHILAISGLHIGLVIFILLAILRLLRIRRRPAAFLCIGFLIFYCFLTGARISVVRAVIMGSVFLFGWVLDRDSDVYNSLGLSAFCILLFNPYQLSDVGFQLSFIAVLSIIYLSPRLEKMFKFFKNSSFNFKGRMKNYIFKGVNASFCAWLGVLPITLYYFNLASNMTVLSNLIVLPLLSVILGLGFLMSAISFIWLGLANIFSQTLWLMLFIMIKSIKFFEKFPYAYFSCKSISIPTILLYYLLILAMFNYDKIKTFIWPLKRLQKSLITEIAQDYRDL